MEYYGNKVCKPVYVSYCRINEKMDKYKGQINLHMSYREMEEKFLKSEK